MVSVIKQKVHKFIIFNKWSLPILIYYNYNKTLKNSFLKNISKLLFSVRKMFLITLKAKYFQQKNLCKIQTPEVATEPILEVAIEPTKATKTKAKAKRKISKLKLRKEFLNEIQNKEKNINEQLFR